MDTQERRAAPEAPQDGAGVAQMRAVTVSREYGSGGGEIARRLADRLGWRLVDHEVVMEVARVLGVSEAAAAGHDEQVNSLAWRIIHSLGLASTAVTGPLPGELTLEQPDYEEARRLVVEGALQAGPAVIVGRGAQVLLAPRRDVLHVRIVAPLAQRVQYVMRREGLDQAAAQHRIAAKDRTRADFLLAVHHQNPADALLYDLVVNTGLLALDSAVDLVLLALERKARHLQTPAEALGPGAGLAPYPAPPGDTWPVAPPRAE